MTERELVERELSLLEQERSLHALQDSHDKRQSVLSELRGYLDERVEQFRESAGRAGLEQGDLDALLAFDPLPETQLAGRVKVCEQREAAVARRRECLERSMAAHRDLEHALLARKNQLSAAFRRLVTGPGAISYDEEAEIEGRNRRQFRRIEVGAHVDFGTEHNFIAGRTSNVSAGGVFLATRNMLSRGRTVRLVLTLPDTGRTEVDGVVVWRREEDGPEGPPGLGIELGAISEEARAAIATFVAQREPMPV